VAPSARAPVRLAPAQARLAVQTRPSVPPVPVAAASRVPRPPYVTGPVSALPSPPEAPPKTKEAWEARRTQLREQLLVATGLWPLPEKTPLNAVVHGKIERDGYTIEKVYFASMPGHYVSGNLYRPTAKVEGDELFGSPQFTVSVCVSSRPGSL